jgi:rod shape-determining protein MreC
MAKRSQYVALSLVCLLVLLLLSLPDQAAVKLKLALSSLFLPLFGLVGSSHGLAEQTGQAVLPRRALLQQVEELRRENQQLRLQAAQAREAQLENARLRQLLGWQGQSPWRLKPARIIARDTANWWRTVWIDRGRRDGLRPDLPVLTAEGLVGRIGETGHATAVVVLVGDPKCRVAVVVRETGENGVLSSSSGEVLDHRLVDLTHLPRNTNLKPGQTVYTSGLGGVFPAGIPVGAVVDSRAVSYGLYTEARVKLTVDSSPLTEVMVMLP